jgi:hypothetical protein
MENKVPKYYDPNRNISYEADSCIPLAPATSAVKPFMQTTFYLLIIIDDTFNLNIQIDFFAGFSSGL